MVRPYLIIYIALSFGVIHGAPAQDSLAFDGQLSSWLLMNPSNELPVYAGARYIPELNLYFPLKNNRMLDMEASANIFGNLGFQPFDTAHGDGYLKPYRAWVRYSTSQLEIRMGLQKINFGSASLLRPLMWFDRIDPRDPLQLTDGVWGVLGRYYWLNNANLWLWVLYGNENLKGWESIPSRKDIPEFGGRIQLPLPKGETALSYHHRIAESSTLPDSAMQYDKIPENRFGFDARWDAVVGLWAEASWSHFSKDIGALTNQYLLNLGMDYTFGIGNGLALKFEQLFASQDKQEMHFSNGTTFSLASLSYPVGLFDNVSGIVYFDWTNNKIYSFINWQRQFNKISLYLMGYFNPKEYDIPTQQEGQMLFAGNGLQIMMVFNH
jgi:hypothetical protein